MNSSKSSAKTRRHLYMRPGISIFILVVAGAVSAFYANTRPIPFSSAEWKKGDAKLRFRMKDSLLTARASGTFPNQAAVDSLLGTSDDPTDGNESRHFRLMQWYGNPWYVRINFDEKGNVVQFVVSAD